MNAPSFSSLLESVRDAEQDFEWYPTTDRMVEAVTRWIDKTAESIMDIGAGDGRVLVRLARCFEHPPKLYSIEKSMLLVQAQPDEVIPVGTDLFDQNLACLPTDYVFCNPPYSQFQAWASIVIETGHARKAFLVLPQRWREDAAIAASLGKRGARARVIHSDDFHDAPRRARAVVDVVEVTYPLEEGRYLRNGRERVRDPFDIWFDETISTFDQEEEHDERTTAYQREQEAIARVRHLTTIEDLVTSYLEEYARMEGNYRAIFQLDYELLRELGVNKEAVREGIKTKMSGLKSRYWAVLFERLEPITSRLSTATKKTFLERLTGRTAVAFTSSNAYAVVLWAIKNANRYFGEQTVALFLELATFEGVMRYKSNVRTWGRDAWRYRQHEEEADRPSHYALDYRVVVERYSAIGEGRWDYPGGLGRTCHELLADVVAVLGNLGFASRGPDSLAREWVGGQWQDWYRAGSTDQVLFQAKAHRNGNVHLRFLPEAIRALNVEAGRLLGWLRSPRDVVEELGYAEDEAERLFSCTRLIALGSAQLMLGEGDSRKGG